MEAGEAALVVLAPARVVHLDVLHVHLRQLVDRLLDLTVELTTSSLANTIYTYTLTTLLT